MLKWKGEGALRVEDLSYQDSINYWKNQPPLKINIPSPMEVVNDEVIGTPTVVKTTKCELVKLPVVIETIDQEPVKEHVNIDIADHDINPESDTQCVG